MPLAAGTRVLRTTPAASVGGPTPTVPVPHYAPGGKHWPLAAGTRVLRTTPAASVGGPTPTVAVPPYAPGGMDWLRRSASVPSSGTRSTRSWVGPELGAEGLYGLANVG